MENNININKKNKYIWIVIVFAILLVGGTLASVISNMLVNNGRYNTVSTCLTVDYDITNDDGTMPITGALFPTVNFYGGLSGKVGLKINDSCSLEGIGSLNLNVSNNTSPIYVQTVDAHCEDSKTLETLTDYNTESDCTAVDGNIWVTNGTALKYAVFDTNEISGETMPVSVGYVNKVGSIEIYNNIPVTKTQVNFYVYIWLDGNLSDNSYANIPFDGNISATVVQKPEEEPAPIIYKDTILNGADPVLDEGMIPITISNTGVVTVADISTDWYDYSNKKWANVVLVNENATVDVEGSHSREYYLNNQGTTVLESDILAYYVWVPRYKYKIWTTDATQTTEPQTIDIVFEGKNNTKLKGTSVGDYLTHPAFTFGEDELNGIWVGKFETTGDAATPTIKPNLSSLRSQNISTQFTTSLKFAGGTLTNGNVSFSGSDTYGLTTNSDSHMVKNSEWSAVAYLSHSQYGINEEIYINNSSGYYTGRSGGNVGGSTDTSTYGTYSWIGQVISSNGTYGTITDSTLGTKASTTGNVTGIYDMSGGAWEYVMGWQDNAAGDASGFSVMPNIKYYNLYSSSIFNGNMEINMQLCTLETCGGQALNETFDWYGDYASFVDSGGPWFGRGGYWNAGAYAGVFLADDYDGSVDSFVAWRSVVGVSSKDDSVDGTEKYLVAYDGNGGKGAPLSQTKSYGDELILSNTVPKRDGYTFLGWSTSSNAKNATYSAGSIFNLNYSVRLYAVWKREDINPLTSYSCANGSIGSEPFDLTYTGNCTVIDDGDGNWRVKFLSTGVHTLTLIGEKTIDVFLVGGGGAGGGVYNSSSTGGGGGYTKTQKNLQLLSVSYELTIGAGGIVNASGIGGTGGVSKFVISESNIISVDGGKGGGYSYWSSSSDYAYGIGGNGGSGGGGIYGIGGSYGGNGAFLEGYSGTGGIGSGFTTCEFGEGTISGCDKGDDYAYAGGGGGASASGGAGGGGDGGISLGEEYGWPGDYGEAGVDNTGGGGGASACGVSCGQMAGGAGGSGIIIIRNAR